MTAAHRAGPLDKADALERIRAVVGPKGLVEDAAARAACLVDWRGLWRGEAMAVVRPASTEEVAAVVRICAEARLPVVPQGGNTGLVGASVPGPEGGILLSTARLNRIRALDAANFTATAEAGVVLADLQAAAAAADRLFPLSIGAEGTCQVGGLVSTNAGGLSVLRYGTTRELTLGLEAVLPDGRVWDGLRALRKDNTGYDLKQLLIGAEGTLGVVTAAVLKLFPAPRQTHTALVALAGLEALLPLLERLRAAGNDALTSLELMPRAGVELALAHVPGAADPFGEAHAWYALVEMRSADPELPLGEALERALGGALENDLVVDAVLASSEDQRQRLWFLREAIVEGEAREGGSIKHDVSVPLSAVPAFIEQGSAAVAAWRPGTRVLAFGHAGDGNVHFNLAPPVGMDAAAFQAGRDQAMRLVHDVAAGLGGSISAEHGIGRLKRDELGRCRPALELELMAAVKQALDPQGIMNPGALLEPEPRHGPQRRHGP